MKRGKGTEGEKEYRRDGNSAMGGALKREEVYKWRGERYGCLGGSAKLVQDGELANIHKTLTHIPPTNHLYLQNPQYIT